MESSQAAQSEEIIYIRVGKELRGDETKAFSFAWLALSQACL